MAWTAKPNGTITLKSTGLASSLTKAWVIDEGTGETWNEYVSGTDNIVWASGDNSWGSNPTTATIGQKNTTTGPPNISESAGTMVFIITPSLWDYDQADFELCAIPGATSGHDLDIGYNRFDKRYAGAFAFDLTSQVIANPGTAYTADADLNQHVVVVAAWENNVAPSTDNGIRMVVKRKDEPETVSGTAGATGGGGTDTHNLEILLNDSQASATIEFEGIFYWNSRLSDADMDTLADDPWGTLAAASGTTNNVTLQDLDSCAATDGSPIQ
jgi:hypothetical protein